MPLLLRIVAVWVVLIAVEFVHGIWRALLLVPVVVWTVLTVIFEFTFGHLIFGRSWKDLASEYDLAHQGFLGLGMVVLLLSPAIASRLCGRARP